MINPAHLHSELTFQTARSGGKGGQNVNKVETKVELRWDLANSTLISDEQRVLLSGKLASRLTSAGLLILYHQTERSQLANKERVIAKFDQLIVKALEVQKPRKPTKRSLSSVLDRLHTKTRRSTVKSLRRRPAED